MKIKMIMYRVLMFYNKINECRKQIEEEKRQNYSNLCQSLIYKITSNLYKDRRKY